MKDNRFFHASYLLFLSILFVACSSQTNAPLAASSTQNPTAPTVATRASQSSASATVASAPLELVRRISGDPNPFSMPAALSFDSNGNMYVLDAGNSRVQVFDPSGGFVTLWGSEGSGEGQFELVAHEDTVYSVGGIALDKNNDVFVVDALNHRLQKFDSTGKYLMEWGGYGLNDGQFVRPIDVAVDAQGNVYVVDDHRDDIQKFDSQGNFIGKFGSHGTGDGQLNNTGGITIGPDGNLYLADYGNNRVEVFTPDGQYLKQWPTTSRDVDIAFDSKGNSFTTHENGDLVEYDSSGEPISIINSLGLNSPVGIAVDANGLIYVADNNGIEVFMEK